MIKKFIKYLFLLLPNLFWGQGNITAYVDYRQNFVVFDNGIEKTLEIQPVVNFKIGGKCVAYIDNLGYFKIYENGKTKTVAFGTNIDYQCTDNLVTFFFNDQLWIYENGEKRMLSLWVNNYKTSDYTVAFLDNQKNGLYVFQNDELKKLEDVQTNVIDLNYKVGENLVAYTLINDFKVFYAGETFEITFNALPTSFEAGRNIVAFNNPIEQTFSVFYKGVVTKLEDFQPLWYKVGDNMVVYKDQLNNLKIFDKGEVKTLTNYNVQDIDIQDNVCTFVEQGQFKVYFNGKIEILEFFVPVSKILENNCVLYLDQTNSLKLFDGTKSQIVTSERVSNFDININTIIFQNSAGRNRIYHKGVLY